MNTPEMQKLLSRNIVIRSRLIKTLQHELADQTVDGIMEQVYKLVDSELLIDREKNKKSYLEMMLDI